MSDTPLILFCGESGGVGRSDQRYREMTKVYSVLSAPTYWEGAERHTFFNRLRHRLGFVLDSTRANAALIERANEKPDIAWIEKGLSIGPSALKAVHRVSPQTRICLWLEEFIDYRTNHSWPLRGALPHYDWIFTPIKANLGSHGLRN